MSAANTSNKDAVKLLGAGAHPVAHAMVDGGVWLEITDREAARKAAAAGGNGMDEYFDIISGHRAMTKPSFFALASNDDGDIRVDVFLAAYERGADRRGRWGLVPDWGRAAGFGNASPYPDHAEAIEALVQARNLEWAPNHLGKAIQVEEAGMELQM